MRPANSYWYPFPPLSHNLYCRCSYVAMAEDVPHIHPSISILLLVCHLCIYSLCIETSKCLQQLCHQWGLHSMVTSRFVYSCLVYSCFVYRINYSESYCSFSGFIDQYSITHLLHITQALITYMYIPTHNEYRVAVNVRAKHSFTCFHNRAETAKIRSCELYLPIELPPAILLD